MVSEFKKFERNIRSITSQDYNRAYPLVGKIVKCTDNMEFCDVEVTVNGSSQVYPNVPAHGFPVEGSTGIIFFHNGNFEQPVCDCAYRLNPPEETLQRYYNSRCFNWLDNGNFFNGTTGYNKDGEEIELFDGPNVTGSEKSCNLKEKGDRLEVDVDISKCYTTYFKFQCNYMGAGTLKVECVDNDTGEIIPVMPYTLERDYMIWTNPRGRFGWSYNKTVYPRKDLDENIHKNIKIIITNHSEDVGKMMANVDGELKEVDSYHAMLLDGLLVYEENSDKRFYLSENDSKKMYSLMTD